MAQNAILRLTHRSEALKTVTDVNVIYPLIKKEDRAHGNARYIHCVKHEQPLKVLYLIHGGGDDYSAWVNNTRLALYAEKHPDLLIVMPTVRDFQSFRTDMDYYKYVSEELPAYIGKLFNVSDQREHTFIAGLSMGGYLSYRIAMLNPERYACVGSLSSPLDIVQDMIERHIGSRTMRSPEELIGDPFREIRTIVDNNIKNHVVMPRSFQCCGTEDMTYAINCGMRLFFEGRGLDHTYREGPGVHNWYFWDEYIDYLLDWLPLDKKEEK